MPLDLPLPPRPLFPRDRGGGRELNPSITVIQAWPFALDEATAAAFLSQGVSNFRKLVRLYPDMLRPYNHLDNGDNRWSQDQLIKFDQWRQSLGRTSA